jgi:hypothetical protein
MNQLTVTAVAHLSGANAAAATVAAGRAVQLRHEAVVNYEGQGGEHSRRVPPHSC